MEDIESKSLMNLICKPSFPLADLLRVGEDRNRIPFDAAFLRFPRLLSSASRDINNDTDDIPLHPDPEIGDGNCSGSNGSVLSLSNDDADLSFPLTLFSPTKMAKKRTYQALLLPSGHASFLILQLQPPPKKMVARSSRRTEDEPEGRGGSIPNKFAHLPPPNLAAANRSSVSSLGSKDSRLSKSTVSTGSSHHSQNNIHNNVVLHRGRHAKSSSSGQLASTLSGRTGGTNGSALSL
jgi:hypothetical protein